MALAGVVVGMKVVRVGDDGVVVVVECRGREWRRCGDASERTLKEQQKWDMKMKVKNEHFCKLGGGTVIL